MNTETELTDLLRTASGAIGDRPLADPAALISRARSLRHRRRAVGLAAVAVMALLGAVTVPSLRGGGHRSVDVAAGRSDRAFPPGWSQLPAPPLRPRVGAVAATAGGRVVVLGGWPYNCALGAGCPRTAPLTDGAAFDLSTRTWHPIAGSPQPVYVQAPAVVGDDIYVLGAGSAPPCPAAAGCLGISAPALLRYRPAADAWDVLNGPPASGSSGPGQHTLVSVGQQLVAYSPYANDQDWRLDTGTGGQGSWVRLPPDPVGSSSSRQMVAAVPDLVLLATHRSPAGVNPTFGARLDLAKGAWSNLPAPPVADPGHVLKVSFTEQMWAVDDSAVAGAGATAFRLVDGSWRPLPAPASTDPVLLAGVVGATTSAFTSATGWVLDLPTEQWVQLPPLDTGPAPVNGAVTAVGRDLFLFGGQIPSGQAVNDAWVWSPPDAASPVASTPTTAVAATAPAPPPATGTIAPTSAPPPPAPGAPTLLSATGDASAGHITLRFSRPVVAGDGPPGVNVPAGPGPNPNPNPNPSLPAGYMTAMNLIVFGADRGCSSPQGNAHAYLSGVGTDTITVEASSLVPGTTYISVGSGVFKSAQGGIANAATGCTAIKVSGTVPTMPPTTVARNAPELLSATGDAAAGRITLRFTRPVVPGDGPNVNPPSNTPPLTDPSLVAMQLVVFMTDASCAQPNGNAHQYLSGVGTDTITVEATSLVAGTTYIGVGPGFVKGVGDGAALKPVPCIGIKVT